MRKASQSALFLSTVVLGKGDDVKRLHAVVGRTFEHFAGLADPMLASTVLQTAVNAYRDAGLRDDSKRTRILMEEKIGVRPMKW